MKLWLEPFEHGFMLDAMMVGVVTGAMCAVLSCFLILKGWSLMGDAVSHAVLPGVVVAYWCGLPLMLGAFAAGLLCAAGSGYLKKHSRLKEDTAMGVIFTGMFGFGLVLFSKSGSDLHLDHVLVGDILGMSEPQVIRILWMGGLVLLASLLFRRDLLLICFDPQQAKIMGLREDLMTYSLLALLSLSIVVAMQAVGVILVVAMLVIPGCVGYLWTDRFDRMLVISVVSSFVSVLVGIMVSYHANASTSGCMVLVLTVAFVFSLLFAPKHGMRAKWRKSGDVRRQNMI